MGDLGLDHSSRTLTLVFVLAVSLSIVLFSQLFVTPQAFAFPNQPLPPIPVGQCPQGVTVDTAASPVLIYVTNGCDNTVSVINEATAATIATIALPAGSSPIGIDADTVNHIIYVADNGGSAVSIINGATNPPTLVSTVTITGSNPTQVAVDSVLSPPQIYVTDPGEGKVQVLSGSVASSIIVSAAITNGLSVSNSPTGLAVDKINHLLFVDLNGTGGVNVYDCHTGTCGSSIATISDGAKGRMAVDGTHTKLYHVDKPNNQIFKDSYSVGPFSAGPTTAIAVGTQPLGIRVNSATQLVYVSNSADNSISVIDGTGVASTLTVPFPSGVGVRGLELDPNLGRLFITFFGGGNGKLLGMMQIATPADTPPAGTPGAPTSILIAPQSSTSVQISWTDPGFQGTGGFSSTAYKISYGNPMTNAAFTVLTGQSSPVTITGLTQNTPYLFKIQAHDTAGFGQAATIPFFLSSNINTNAQLIPPPIDLTLSSNFGVMQSFLNHGAPAGFSLPSAPFILGSANFHPFDSTFKGLTVNFTTATTPPSSPAALATLAASYNVQTYTPQASWTSGSGNTFTVPGVAAPLAGGAIGNLTIGEASKIVPNAPILFAGDTKPLPTGVTFTGLKYTLSNTVGTTDTNVQESTGISTTPFSGQPTVASAAGYFQFTFSGNTVDYSNPSNFASISLPITVGQQAGEIPSAVSPTNTVNSAITCPAVNFGSISSGGTVDFATPTVTRDTSGDTSTACGYDVTFQHFSGGVAQVSTATAGGNGRTYFPPKLSGSNYGPNEYPLTIAGKGIALPSLTNTIPTNIIQTGTPTSIKLLIFSPQGSSAISHVGVYMNLGGSNVDLYSSDTSLIYDKGKPLAITDPNKFFSSANVNPETNGTKFSLSFNVIFAKPMATSNIVIRTWDIYGESMDARVLNAIQVTGSQIVNNVTSSTIAKSSSLSVTPTIVSNSSSGLIAPVASNTSSSVTQSNPAVTVTSQPNSGTDLMSEIKAWGGYSPQAISDSELLKDVGINANHIPPWVLKTTKWVDDGELSPQDFVNALQYLAKEGIIK